MQNPTPLPTRKLHFARAALTTLALGVVATGYASGLLPCGVARVFHEPCPGCGSTRAMHALLSGDVSGAMHLNPTAPFLVLCLGILAAQAVVSEARTGTMNELGRGRSGKVAFYGFLAVTVVSVIVWIARFFGFLGGPVAV